MATTIFSLFGKNYKICCAFRPRQNSFINKNAIKLHYSPKWGTFLEVGNVLGNLAYFREFHETVFKKHYMSSGHETLSLKYSEKSSIHPMRYKAPVN